MRLRTTVREGTSVILNTTITDLDGEPLAPADLDSLTLDLYDEPTRTIINDRDSQDVLNANGGTLDLDGGFELLLDPADTEVVNAALTREWHVALLTWVWTVSAVEYTSKAAIKYKVLNEDPTLVSSLVGCGCGPYWFGHSHGWC